MKRLFRNSGGTKCGLGLVAALAALAAVLGLPEPVRAQEPVNCDSLSVELADLFVNPICHRARFRSSGTIGRTESIHGETPDYLMNFQSSRSGSGYTYLYAIDFETIMGYYGIADTLEIIGAEKEAIDGFKYVSVGGPGLDSCILFLKQSRPIRSGFRAQYFGIACDKRRQGEYSPEDATALLDLIKDY